MTDPMTTPQISLKPCPLCGGKPKTDRYSPLIEVPGSAVIKCEKCMLTLLERTPEKAIAAWNTRQPERPDVRHEDRKLCPYERCPDRPVRQALEALKLAAELRTDQDCPPENHGVVIAAMHAIKALAQPEAKEEPQADRMREEEFQSQRSAMLSLLEMQKDAEAELSKVRATLKSMWSKDSHHAYGLNAEILLLRRCVKRIQSERKKCAALRSEPSPKREEA